jgi:tetratricopeptide (TPR) repeat protein
MHELPLIHKLIVRYWLILILCAIFGVVARVALPGLLNIETVSVYKEFTMKTFDADCKLDRTLDTEPYIPLVACALRMSRSNSAYALRIVDEAKNSFPARALMLSTYVGKVEYELKDYAASCLALSKAGAKVHLIDLAARAYAADNWAGMATYLECVNAIKSADGEVAASHVAEMYDQLGRHYQEIGEQVKAITAFERSIMWYAPSIYARPLVALTEIKRHEGDLVGAIQMLITALPRIKDRKTTFDILRELGFVLEDKGDAQSAYCAYVKARWAAEVLDPSQAPVAWLQDLDKRITTLGMNSQIDQTVCQTIWTDWSVTP